MIIIVGASACGKTEVAHALKKEFGITKAITHTTRNPRQGEKTGVDYFFVTEDEFESMERRNMFVETTTYNSYHYGTSKTQIDDDKVLIVDPRGLDSFLRIGNESIVAFNLIASKETRIERMEKRGDKKEDIEKRIKTDDVDFAPSKVANAHYEIDTERKSVLEVAEEIYRLYVQELTKRGITPNLLID